MKEIGLQNCYNLYNEKFGESIQNVLEQAITESEKEVDAKIENFTKEYFINPGKLPTSERNTSVLQKEILNKVLTSKAVLLANLNSPYANLYMNYRLDIPELARRITWHWLSSAGSQQTIQFQITELKETLVTVGYNFFIYYFNDQLPSLLEEQGQVVEWPKSKNLEIFQINRLEEEIGQEKKLREILQLREQKEMQEVRQKNKNLLDELDAIKEDLYLTKSELSLRKAEYFLQEDDLYTNYVFGDILPELKSVYNLLKEYKLYDSNWGYFCHCLTVTNYNSPEPLKLSLNLQGRDFDSKDLGYILNLLQNKFFKPQKLEYLDWLAKVVELKSGLGKVIKDIPDFYKKKVRPYKNGKSQPRFYDEINNKMSYFTIQSL